ncbi:MAG: TIM barrel protein [Rhodobacteraceae bacterium]|nr:TIM barrel protein [Paracoccaceae bacterium]
MLPRALNHMAVPGLRWDAFLDLARQLGCAGVEFRDDLNGPLFDGDDPEKVKAAASARDLRILALAEVKCFNDWSDARRHEAEALMRIAAACGAGAVSLIPRNDGLGCGNGERQANLRVALRELKPMLQQHRLTGLVEPLGFEICSLRSKAETVEAIEALGAAGCFKLVHDTFHHSLAGGGPVFAGHTGIVHISGVTDRALALHEMRDEHRVLVDAQDRLGNIAQIDELQRAGYQGLCSFEPFAPAVHALTDPAAALAGSFEFIASGLAR